MLIIPVMDEAIAAVTALSIGMLMKRLSRNVLPPSWLNTLTIMTTRTSNIKKAAINPHDHLPNRVVGNIATLLLYTYIAITGFNKGYCDQEFASLIKFNQRGGLSFET